MVVLARFHCILHLKPPLSLPTTCSSESLGNQNLPQLRCISYIRGRCKIRCLLSRGLEEKIGNPTCTYRQFIFNSFRSMVSFWPLSQGYMLQSVFQPWSRSPYSKNNCKTKPYEVGAMMMPRWRDIDRYPTLWKRNFLVFPNAILERKQEGTEFPLVAPQSEREGQV